MERSVTHISMYTLTPSLTHSLTHLHTHSLTHSPPHSLTHSLTYTLTHLHTHSLTHPSLTQSPLTHSLSHTHTHTHTHTHLATAHTNTVQCWLLTVAHAAVYSVLTVFQHCSALVNSVSISLCTNVRRTVEPLYNEQVGQVLLLRCLLLEPSIYWRSTIAN